MKTYDVTFAAVVTVFAEDTMEAREKADRLAGRMEGELDYYAPALVPAAVTVDDIIEREE